MKRVLLWPNPTLKLVSAPVDIQELNADPTAVKALVDLAKDMATTMGTYRGVGLAAVQIGIPVRVITTYTDGTPRVYVNPRVVRLEGGSRMVREGCLSIPGIFEQTRRSESVVLAFQPLLTDSVGAEETFTAHGLLAQVLAHECEHLDGKIAMVDDAPSATRQLIRGDLSKRRRGGLLRDYV